MSCARAGNSILAAPARLSLGFLLGYALGAILIFGYLDYQSRAVVTGETDQVLREQQVLLTQRYREAGISGVSRAIRNEISERGKREHSYRILDGNGALLFQAGALPLPEVRPFTGIREVEMNPSSEQKKPAARVLGFALSENATALIADDMQSPSRTLRSVRSVLIQGVILVLLLGLVAGLWLANHFWRQVEAFNQLAMKLAHSGNLAGRMPVTGKDAFAALAANLNAMLERIEKLFQGIRQVSDNIAHDLRSPLTRLRADVEVALQGNDADAQRATLERVLLELQNMQNTFNSLLSIGQAEAGSLKLRRKQTDLSELLESMVELYTPFAEEHQLTLHAEISPGLQLNADRQLLAQAMSNLFDNAIKYVPAGGRIELRAAPAGNNIEIHMEDSGPGIPPEKREEVFDRFTRLDPSRTLPGTGLGLSLVKAFIELHQGSITLSESGLGGAAFTILLPLN